VTQEKPVNAVIQEQLGNYVATFDEFRKSAVGWHLPWLTARREGGFAQFAKTGFPTTNVEDWRFTNVAPVAKTEFQLARPRDQELAALRDQIEGYRIPDVAGRLVFVNGHFVPEFSSLVTLPAEIFAANLAAQLQKDPQRLEPHMGKYLNVNRDPFCALNTAFLEDGAFIHIRRGAVLQAPIHLLFISVAGEIPLMNHPRNLIVAEDGSELTVVEEFVSLGNTPVFCNAATELVAGEEAVVSHYRIERENPGTFQISTLRVQQVKSANVATHSVLLGGALVRNNVHPVLAGEGGECLINGLFLGRGREHLDNYMLVEHNSPHCESRQFYHGILDDHAHGVFHGRIIVHKDAQKTDAKQTNRNLLLSDDAQIDTKPQLEIFADDVKCTHGATIGQIEENALFYLRSRGIDELAARRLLLEAFANECLDRMKEGPARTHIADLIRAHISGMAATEKQHAKEPAETGQQERHWEELQ
jgi:Fe-S cluster assembly protein SufD